RVIVRDPLPGWKVTWKVPSRAPSGPKVVLPCPTLSRSRPRNESTSVGGGGWTVKPPGRTADLPSGLVTLTSRGPAAPAAMAIAAEIWVPEDTVVEPTVMPVPKDTVAPDWKLVPAMVTVKLVPGAPVFGDTLEIDG